MKLRLDCVSKHLSRTWLWVDMTKVGKLDYAIQIPRDVYDLVLARQVKTVQKYRLKHGVEPSADSLALTSANSSPRGQAPTQRARRSGRCHEPED